LSRIRLGGIDFLRDGCHLFGQKYNSDTTTLISPAEPDNIGYLLSLENCGTSLGTYGNIATVSSTRKRTWLRDLWGFISTDGSRVFFSISALVPYELPIVTLFICPWPNYWNATSIIKPNGWLLQNLLSGRRDTRLGMTTIGRPGWLMV
jgi:hypothetical protein